MDAVLAARPSTAAARAAACEAAGYDAVWIGETKHDPFVLAAAAAPATSSTLVGTSVAIAFARTPMTVAYQAWDLNELCGGRFALGLGTQVRSHVERRYAMTWSRPAARMREFIVAVREIWASWRSGEPLRFEGDFYEHTLMTPFFTPDAVDLAPPPVYLAAVGPLMTEVAGEVADGVFFHPFTTASYLREVATASLARGRERSGRAGDPFAVCGPVFVVTGDTEAELDVARAAVKHQIAFYGSTPSYRAVLEHHGWGDVQPELTTLTKRGAWTELATLIDDAMLDAFAVVGPPESIGPGLVSRYGEIATRISLNTPYDLAEPVRERVVESLRSAR